MISPGAWAALRAAAKSAAEGVAKTAAEGAAKSVGKETAQSVAKKAAEFASKNAGKIIGGLAAVAAGLYAQDKFNELNGKKVGITKTEAGSTGLAFGIGANKKIVLLTYTPALKIRNQDRIAIVGSKTTPSIDGEYDVKDAKTDTTVVIDVGKDVTGYAPGGDFTLKTTFEAQVLGLMADTAATAGEAAGEVLEAGGEAAGKGFEGLMKGLGISMDTVKYVGIGIVVIFIIFVILKLMAKKKSG